MRQLERYLFENIEKDLVGEEETEVEFEFVLFLFVGVVTDESHFVMDVEVVLFEFVPVVFFGFVIVFSVLVFHVFLEDFDEPVEHDHELFGFGLGG